MNHQPLTTAMLRDEARRQLSERGEKEEHYLDDVVTECVIRVQRQAHEIARSRGASRDRLVEQLVRDAIVQVIRDDSDAN